ncbi:hypothetical protein G6514_005375 [Epicoccum nigrum]|nr:hypothetical protein G6514_005375 [Epicoccum nigrum]
MHPPNVLGLWSMCMTVAYALTIPQVQDGSLVRRDDWHIDSSITADVLKRATAPKPKPAAAAKPPATPAKPPASPVKPPAAPVKPPAAPVKPPAAPVKPPVTPAKPIVWPKVKVPRPTTAINTCGILVSCDEAEIEQETQEAPARRALPSLVRRDIRTFKVSGMKLTMKNLDYPGAADLYSVANPQVNVFDYNSPDMDKHQVKNSKTKPTNYDEYITEHIVELQTIKQFLGEAGKNDANIKKFVEEWWNKELDPVKASKRPNKPPITMGDRTTINKMVFEALGSDNNREDFVLCHEEINGYKARIWDLKAPMALTSPKKVKGKYTLAVEDAVAGKTDSNMYLSGLRATLAVFDYLNEPEVRSRLQRSVKHVGMELENAEYLTGVKIDLATPWKNFMKGRMLTLEDHAQKWIKKAIETETEVPLTNMITALKKKEADLIKEETGPGKGPHETKAKLASDNLDKEIKAAETAVTAQENDLKSKNAVLKTKRTVFNKAEKDLKDKTKELDKIKKDIAKEKDATKLANLNKEKTTIEQRESQLEVEKNTAENNKKVAEKERDAAKKDVVKKEKLLGLKRREKFSLRSEWLKQVIDGLEKDKKIVAAYKAAGAAAKFPSAV